MLPLLVYEGSDGALYDGVTRATRLAKLLPGTTVQVEVIGKLKRPKGKIAASGTRSLDANLRTLRCVSTREEVQS
jgi:hypothetical protein